MVRKERIMGNIDAQVIVDQIDKLIDDYKEFDKTDGIEVGEFLADVTSTTVGILKKLEGDNREKKKIACDIAIKAYEKAGINVIPFDGQIIEHKLVKHAVGWLVEAAVKFMKGKDNG